MKFKIGMLIALEPIEPVSLNQYDMINLLPSCFWHYLILITLHFLLCLLCLFMIQRLAGYIFYFFGKIGKQFSGHEFIHYWVTSAVKSLFRKIQNSFSEKSRKKLSYFMVNKVSNYNFCSSRKFTPLLTEVKINLMALFYKRFVLYFAY